MRPYADDRTAERLRPQRADAVVPEPRLQAVASSAPPALVTAAELVARPRPPLDPFVATTDGRSVLLARDTTLIVAGPSSAGKSLAAVFDLGGRLAADQASEWLGLRVRGGLRVVALSYEGSEEDTDERLRALVPEDARDRLALLDRFDRVRPELRAGEPHRQMLADLLRDHATDVLMIDTGAAFFGDVFDISTGIPEAAYDVLEDLRARSGLRFAVVVVLHTRKADRGGAHVDELEEIAGTFPRKADAAIVLRRESEDSPRRIVRFPKVRRGPEPRPLVATFPTIEDTPPRLEVVAEAGRPVKAGTDADAMAEWIAAQSQPVTAAQLRARFDVSDTALKERRRDQLEALGVHRERLPGRGNTMGYGTAEQWARMKLGGAS